jgi:pimeloyl-ACP methyl ester carboxylesterase
VPSLEAIEDRLAQRPRITIPAFTLDGALDPLKPGGTAGHADRFAGWHAHRTLDCGHNPPQEAPGAFADAILETRAAVPGSR